MPQPAQPQGSSESGPADERVPAVNAATKEPPLLELKGVSKRFGPLEALTGVDFEVDAGEVVALVGDNGAGKSTLIKAIAGVQLCDEGTFSMRGAEVTISSPKDATTLGITTVYQDLALCDNLDIVANLFLGHERFPKSTARVAGYIDEIEMEKSSLKLLESLSVTTISDVRAHVASLSGGQRQAVAIARSLIGEPSVVLLDEPTAALGVVQTKQVLNLIRTLRERGLGVVIISHNLADVFEVADRIIVLRLGGRVATFDVRGVSHEDVVAAITGAEFGAAPGELKEQT
jgi:D-xylose transport system ATP-binding protein